MTSERQHLELTIEGMHCGSCAGKIERALDGTSGIDSARVSHQAGTAIVTTHIDLDDDALARAVASAGDYRVTSVDRARSMSSESSGPTVASPPAMSDDDTPPESLYPLFLIVGFIAGVTVLIALATETWAIEPMMRHFMAGFFIVFSFFKLLDPPGFVSAYRGYDLIARKLPAWGWAYPFVELTLGVAYLLVWAPVATNTVTLLLMLVGAAGVLKALLDKRAIRCACLGTALNLPMTKVTLVEDLTMAAMAAVMLALLL
ncbi:MAG: heavy metal-associated domain-containing protein [Planctomycetota bacterium]